MWIHFLSLFLHLQFGNALHEFLCDVLNLQRKILRWTQRDALWWLRLPADSAILFYHAFMLLNSIYCPINIKCLVACIQLTKKPPTFLMWRAFVLFSLLMVLCALPGAGKVWLPMDAIPSCWSWMPTLLRPCRFWKDTKPVLSRWDYPIYGVLLYSGVYVILLNHWKYLTWCSTWFSHEISCKIHVFFMISFAAESHHTCWNLSWGWWYIFLANIEYKR